MDLPRIKLNYPVGFAIAYFLTRFVFRTVTIIASMLFTLKGRAADLDVKSQKGCTVLVSPKDDLAKGRTYVTETSSGKKVKIRVTKMKSKGAVARIVSKSRRCPKLFGETLALGSKRLKKKFYAGVQASAGQFTFRQPFIPTDVNSTSDESIAQNINGLAGLGFTGGGTARFVVWSTVALDLGIGVLSSTASGSTKLTNGEPYVVTGKFLETVIQPGVVAVRCFSSRLLCRGGGTFAIPINSSLTIESPNLNLVSPLKYTRMGGDFSLGVNFSDNFSLQLGAQITQSKGEFQFPEYELTPVQVLTVFIFGGLSAVF